MTVPKSSPSGLLKLLFLVFNGLQWIVCVVLASSLKNPAEHVYASLLLALLGSALYSIFYIIAPKLKKVSFEHNKLSISLRGRMEEISFHEIKSITRTIFIPLFRISLHKMGVIYVVSMPHLEPHLLALKKHYELQKTERETKKAIPALEHARV